MMDMLKQMMKKMDVNLQSLKEDNRVLKEGQRSINEKLQSMIEDTRESTEKLRREREQREQSNPKIDDKQMEIEKVPEDKNMEQASPEPEDSGEKKVQIIQKTEEVKMEE